MNNEPIESDEPVESDGDVQQPPNLPDDRNADDVADEVGETEAAHTAWSRWSSEPMPALPKMAAVRRAAEAGLAAGLPEPFAWALATAATDPAGLRAALNSKRTMPVVGGEFEFIEIDLWTPGVTPMVTNHRAFAERVYPASGSAGEMGPLRGPSSANGATSTLRTEARDVSHVLREAERARTFILSENKLAASIAERGIMMPVDVVYNEIYHTNGEPTACLLATAEGSSRVTNAHQVLGIADARTVMYDLPADGDRLRRYINSILEDDPDEPGLTSRGSDKRRGRRNALIVRARVILRFVPAVASPYDFAQAISGYLGMLHVSGPRPWPTTGRNEAMAESVVRALRHEGVISDEDHDYLAGLMDPATAVKNGFPGTPDAQAARVIEIMLDPELRPIVSRAIRDVTSAAQASASAKAEAAAELALRPIRSLAATLPAEDPDRRRIDAMQAVYRRACRLRLYATAAWSVTGRSPEELLDAALKELADSADTPTEAGDYSTRTELAALAQFHLTRWASLRREPYGSGGTDTDKRGPHDVLLAMMKEPHGLRLLYQAIIDGRAGRAPRIVDENGQLVHGHISGSGALVHDPDQGEVDISDRWLRDDAFPRVGMHRPMPTPPPSETPSMALARLKAQVERSLELLEDNIEKLEGLTEGEATTPLIEMQGWSTEGVLQRLDDLRSRLSFWNGLASRIARRERPATEEN
ncbi:hypothetical protein Ait01nite_052930 [Actinoplanes italicus]|uniref:Uncharacterized protein n=1 Tax=Actinoplanes italicus TaxID=113567 RepID=A0A2T0JZP8_9ACTN|nr:hypothetical protein [Actinoplanes italicus]PRX15992.1 hypothetical protein CLV67_12139 [Actinoplanes italicus]GIE32248.1 hypothetical protein Ait01nite_052930 [Actinoplanes italicus]